MTSLDSLGAILKTAVLAGLGAAMVVAAVQFVWTEPVVDRAIALEEQLHAAERSHSAQPAASEEAPIVDRATQKKGLFLGYGIYGLAWGLLFGAAYAIGQDKLPGGRFVRGIVLAAGSCWAVGLLPFLKYPANPPGVGDPDTIEFRQRIYLAMLIGAILVAAAALAIRQRTLARGSLVAVGLPLVCIAVGSALLYFLLPPNPDPVHMPADLVARFRLQSLLGIMLFWAVLGLSFGPLLGVFARRQPARTAYAREPAFPRP